MANYNATAVRTCGWLLKELEAKMKWSATEDWTTEKRTLWIREVDAAVRNNELHKLYSLASDLEKKMKYSMQLDEWKDWKRQYWLRAYFTNYVNTTLTVTHFVHYLKALEYSLKWAASQDSWKESGERDAWLKEANSIMSPVEGALFADDLLNQIDKCIDNNSFSEWEQMVSNACSKLRECANVLDKVAKDVGIAKTAGGGAAIAGGVLAGLGLLAAPFTAGASLAATAAGTAIAVGGGLTTFGAAMAKMGWDNSQTKKAQEATKETCKYTQIIAECISVCGKLMTDFRTFLDTAEGKQLIDQLQSATAKMRKGTLKQIGEISEITFKSGSKLVSLGLAGMKLKELHRIASIISVLRPELAGKLSLKLAESGAAGAIKFSTRWTGPLVFFQVGSVAAKAVTALSSVVGIGFGIWDVIEGSKEIKNGSEIAKKFRKFASDLEDAKKSLAEQYRSMVQ